MHVAIAGGHGKIARLLARQLSQRGGRVRAIIRDPAQTAAVAECGADPFVLDLEQTSIQGLAEAVRGADAVVFAAGAGPGSGAARKETVDYGAAVKLVEAATLAGVRRYVMVSSMGTADPPSGDDVFSVYLRAKARADEALMASGLHWTIVRPGSLTDEPGTSKVAIADRVARGSVPRADVAEVVAACLDDPRTVGRVFELTSGPAPIAMALGDFVR